MSGFEIAGIVLAVLPAAVQAFQVYKTYFPSSKKFQEDLKQLVQDLESERTRLYNTLERLLGPLLDETTTSQELLENPHSPKWEKLGPRIDDQLRTLLYITYNKFKEQLDEINKSSEELRLKLKLPDPRNGLVYDQPVKYLYRDKRSILKAWAARTGFSLRKKSYDTIIGRLKCSNTLLEGLANTALEQKITRTLRSKDHVTRLLRDLLKSLFMALGDASSGCVCPKPPDVYLELVSRKDLWFAKEVESEDEVARGKIGFHLVLNSASLGQTVADGSPRLQPRWATFRVQCCNFGPSSPPLLSPMSPSNSTSSLPVLSTAVSNSHQPSGGPGKIRFTGRTSLPPSILMSQHPHRDPPHPTPAGSTTSLPSYMSGGPVGPISSQEGPRPSSSGKIKFRGPLTKLPAHVLERSIKLGKKVAFSTGSSTSVATLAKTSFSSFTSLEPTKLLNLCEITLGKGKKRASDQDYCHGCIVAISQGRKFALYPPREQDDINLKYQQQSIAEPVEFQTTLTLRQILDSDLQGAHRVPRPRTGDKIRMAVAISESVLHMHSTPWLSKPLTLDDIVFLVNDSSIASERFKLRTFISKPVGCTPSDTKSRHDGNPTVTPSPFYPTAFYLGLLLCQLMLLEDRKLPIATEIDLKAHQVPIPPGAVVMPDSMHKKLSRNAESLLWENEESAGEDYKNIVHWCLVTHNSEKGLDDEDFRKSFYAEVVEKLREKFKHMIYDL